MNVSVCESAAATEKISGNETLRVNHQPNFLRRMFPWVTKGGLAVLDQGLFAGTNFVVNVLLARWLTPAEYGAFALAYSVFLLFATFHSASFTEPMMVFGPGKYSDHFNEYLGVLLRGHFCLMLPGGIILVAASFMLGRIYSASVEHAFLGLAVAAPFILLLWLVRRAFYVRLQPGWAAAGGVLYLTFLLGFMGALWAGQRLSPVTAFLGMGAGAMAVSIFLIFSFQPRRIAVGGVISLVSLLALIYLLWLESRPLPVITFLGMGLIALVVSVFLLRRLGPRWSAPGANPSARAVFTDHWRYGRWSVATAGISWLPSNVYYALLPTWFGLEGAAAFRALMNLSMPVMHTVSALAGILLPTLVGKRKEAGPGGMAKTMKSFLALFMMGSTIYFILLWLLRAQIFRILYAGKYQEYTFMPVLLVGLLPFGSSLIGVLGSALRALEHPDWVFWSYLGAGVVTFAVGIPLVAAIGVSGGLIGLLFSYLATGALMFWFYRRSAQGKSQSAQQAEAHSEEIAAADLVQTFQTATIATPDPEPGLTRGEGHSRPAFLRRLFRLLEEHDVRYCVLHSHDRLPNELPSDLDLAVHPRDVARLALAFRSLKEEGFLPVQRLNYSARGFCSDFIWFEGLVPKSVSVDVVFEYRQGGLILFSGERLVAGRRWRGELWIPDPVMEFEYLLARKTLKGQFPNHHQQRLKSLVEKMGKMRAEESASRLFGEGRKERVVQACADGLLSNHLEELKAGLWLTILKRDPLNPVRYLFSNFVRLIRRWFRPTGLVVVVLGPDGVGKSTVIERVAQALKPPFRHHRIFHWRPMSLWGRQGAGPVTDPHGQIARSPLSSVARLCGLLFDHWYAYWFVTRPLLARAGLVIFDRDYHDLLIDPKRYRYGGPLWLARFFSRILPKPDSLFLVLDAPEDVILSRKRELPRAEVRRQREAYHHLIHRFPNAHRISTEQQVEQTVADASQTILAYMSCRFQTRHRHGLAQAEGLAAGRTLSSRSKDSWRTSEPVQTALAQLIGSHAAISGGTNSRARQGVLSDAVVVKWGNSHIGAMRKFAGEGFTRFRRFTVLPSAASPRWLLPLGDSRCTLAGFQIYSPYAPAARLLKTLATQAIKVGWIGWGGSQVLLASRATFPLESLVTEVTGEGEPLFAMLLGTPGRFRKLTLQVMRRDGEILGYIKLPLTEDAAESVSREVAALRRLWNFPALRPYIPQVLFAGEWSEGQILFQSPGPSRPGPAEFGALHTNFLRTLHGTCQREKAGDLVVEEVAARWKTAEQSLSPEWRELGVKALDRAHRELGRTVVPCGIMHGDFAPWNTRVEDGHLFLFDWESTAWDAPLDWDLFHFHAQVARALSNKRGHTFLASRKSGNRGSFVLYLLHSVAQYVEEGGADHLGIAFRKRLLERKLAPEL